MAAVRTTVAVLKSEADIVLQEESAETALLSGGRVRLPTDLVAEVCGGTQQ